MGDTKIAIGYANEKKAFRSGKKLAERTLMVGGVERVDLLHFFKNENKRLTPKLHRLELLELIRKDFISKKCKLLFGLCEGYLILV